MKSDFVTVAALGRCCRQVVDRKREIDPTEIFHDTYPPCLVGNTYPGTGLPRCPAILNLNPT
jgi:hypothetical protein